MIICRKIVGLSLVIFAVIGCQSEDVNKVKKALSDHPAHTAICISDSGYDNVPVESLASSQQDNVVLCVNRELVKAGERVNPPRLVRTELPKTTYRMPDADIIKLCKEVIGLTGASPDTVVSYEEQAEYYKCALKYWAK